ncbi:hypothetical protein [Niabella ginsenosidivorans]|uniref:hypothetical protein n=1 Tax=Niabella ginsenosidivorans TaxID=1176587 RepID=UPI0012EE75EB|nr:hypothetical protein [Niabella ginsenosidivorans]
MVKIVLEKVYFTHSRVKRIHSTSALLKKLVFDGRAGFIKNGTPEAKREGLFDRWLS